MSESNVGASENTGRDEISNAKTSIEINLYCAVDCGEITSEFRLMNALGLFVQTGHITPAEISDVDSI